MRCNQCGRDVADDAAFCPYCGERMAVTAAVAEARFRGRHAANSSRLPRAPPNRRIRPRPPNAFNKSQRASAAKIRRKRICGAAAFRPKAMLGHCMLAGCITVASLIGVAVAWNTGTGWLCFVAGMVLLWGVAGVTLAYRRLTVHYRLTRFRLFHEHGILTRVTDRIETIDIDDVTVFQGLAERSFGIGTIVVVSTDRTSPELRMRGIDHVKAVADLIDSTRRAERQRRGLHLEST